MNKNYVNRCKNNNLKKNAEKTMKIEHFYDIF